MCIYNMCVRLNLNPSGLKTININEKEEEEDEKKTATQRTRFRIVRDS